MRTDEAACKSSQPPFFHRAKRRHTWFNPPTCFLNCRQAADERLGEPKRMIQDLGEQQKTKLRTYHGKRCLDGPKTAPEYLGHVHPVI